MQKKIALLFLSFPHMTFSFIAIDLPTAKAIGNKIWHNECRATYEGLTSWNRGEEFASLGIGHFIWYPPQQKKIFDETFPALLIFFKKHGKSIPPWLDQQRTKGCLWKTRESFLQKQNSKKMRVLRQLLADTIDLQTEFIILRLKKAINRLSTYSKELPLLHIKKQLTRLIHYPQGIYALIDYVHFKGEGFNNKEQYQGHGWGLMHVLRSMHGKERGKAALEEFCTKAKDILAKRVTLAPAERNEQRWLTGWYNRIDSYLTAQF